MTRDRRSHDRHPGQTLILEIDGEVAPLIDVSLGGIGCECYGLNRGETVAFRLYSALDEEDGVQGRGVVVNTLGTRVGVAFRDPSYSLMEFVVAHIGAVTNTSPYVFVKNNKGGAGVAEK